jgi:DNA-directed RNA polymerase II subunit RPB1
MIFFIIYKKNMEAEKKRKLTKKEIDNILSFIKPNKYIYSVLAENIRDRNKKDLEDQLVLIEIYPSLIPELKKNIINQYKNSFVNFGESVGIQTAQCIGEQNTQSNLNKFHKAGTSSEAQSDSRFSDLLNTTTKPKSLAYFIYFKNSNDKLETLIDNIGSTILDITLSRIVDTYKICINKEQELWYKGFFVFKDKDEYTNYEHCVSCFIKMDIIYEYKITLKSICDFLEKNFEDIKCIFSPDCFGQIDIFFSTLNISCPENISTINSENYIEIYLEEVAYSSIENITIFGISGIKNIFYIKDKNGWYIETENCIKKIENKFKKTKNKSQKSLQMYKNVMALPMVDTTRTISNNIWDILNVLGIEAVRQYMIDEFSDLIQGLNKCHISLLIDNMTFSGTLCSISRYSMRKKKGVFNRGTFEEITENFVNACFNSEKEKIKNGVSASIICGNKPKVGTGLCDISLNMNKLNKEEGGEGEEGEDIFNITKYEKTRVIGTRASQLQKGAKSNLTEKECFNLRDPLKIAEEEYYQNKLPLNIIRNISPNLKVEISF